MTACRWIGAATVALGVFVHADPALAQRAGPVRIDRVDWGFDNSIPAERFFPVTVWLSADRPFSGSVSLEARQDATQNARAVTTAGVTPGVSTPVELLCCVSRSTREAVLVITDGSWSGEVEFSTRAGRRTLPMPLPDHNIERVLCIGDSSVRRAVAGQAAPVTPPTPGAAPTGAQAAEMLWSRVTAPVIAPDRMPLNWMGYDSACVVVVGEEALEGRDPRRIDALRTWLTSGGRVVLVAGRAGSAWRRLLPEGRDGDLFRLHDRATLAADPASFAPPGVEFSPRPVARLVSLTASGEADGWRTVLRAGSPTGQSGGIIAAGPVGLGVLCVVGADPESLCAGDSGERVGAAWRSIVEPLFPPRTRWGGDDYYYWLTGSLTSEIERSSLRAALDSVLDVRVPEWTAVLLITGTMGLLALLLGPVDALVLKRLALRHRSWLTALGWIGLACAGAGLAPSLMRSEPTRVARIIALDTLPGGAPPVVWRCALTGVFSGRPEIIPVRSAPGGVWRGVSPLSAGEDSPLAFGALTLVQRQSDPGPRESAPAPLAMGQWMLRSTMDRSPGLREPAGLSARVTREPGGGWRIDLSGLPEHATVMGARLHTADGWRDFFIETGGTSRTAFVKLDPSSAPVPRWPVPAVYSRVSGTAAALSDADAFSPVFALPGASDRAAAIAARVASGAWACVYVEYADAEGASDAVSFPGLTPACRVCARVPARLDDGDRLAPALPAWPGEKGETP